MMNRQLLEKLKLSPADLKAKFTAKKRSDKIQELIQMTRDRIDEGRRQNLVDYRMWWAMDVAYDVPFKQTTYSMLYGLLDKLGRSDMSSEQVLKAAAELGLTQFVKDTEIKGKKCKSVDLPVFFQIWIPLVRAYVNIRWAKLYNDRNVFPLLKVEPIKQTAKNRARCEILSDAFEMMGQQLGYRPTLKQWIFNMLHYGTAIMFPMEDWYRKRSIRVTDSGDQETYIRKQGLRYNIPHPSRVFYDQMHRVGTVNFDSGCRFAGYWRIVRYRDIMNSSVYWNKDTVSMMDHDLIRNNAVFFATVYPCQMEFASPDNTGISGAGQLDRESNASFYTAAHKDKAVVLSEVFQELVPSEWGLGDVDVPVWFRMSMANDDDPVYVSALCYNPILYMGYDAHEERRRNASLSLEIVPFQDHMSNLITQQILTAKSNLLRVTFANQDLVPKQYLDKITNMGEDMYRAMVVIPYSGRMATQAQSDIRQAFTNIQFPIASTVEIMQAFRLLLDTLERVLVFSAQEVGAVAAHEQTAEETRLIAGNVNNRIALTDSFVDEALYGWKNQLYQALMAYGDDEIWAQVPAIPPVTAQVIQDIGFSIDEPGSPGQTNTQVKGPKSALALEGFASAREGESRINNPEIAAGMTGIMNIMLSNQMTAMALGPEQAIKIFNTISRLAGLPRDFALHVANPELIKRMMEGGDQQQQQQDMQQMFRTLSVEILNRAGEQTVKIVEDALQPISEEHQQLAQATQQNAEAINGFQQMLDQLLSRLKTISAAASQRESSIGAAQ